MNNKNPVKENTGKTSGSGAVAEERQGPNKKSVPKKTTLEYFCISRNQNLVIHPSALSLDVVDVPAQGGIGRRSA